MQALPGAVEWALTSLQPLDLLPNPLLAVRLCVEEALANIITHGQDGHSIRLGLRQEEDRLILEVEDDARPFDPTLWCCRAVNDSVETASIGGRGILLMRHFADQMRYERRDGRNHLTLIFPLGQEA